MTIFMQDFISKHGIKYRCNCDSCGVDRGYKDIHAAKKMCRSCTRKDVHVKKRCNTDFIWILNKKNKKSARLRASCSACGKDRGYIKPVDVKKNCLSCSKVISLKGRGNLNTKIKKSKAQVAKDFIQKYGNDLTESNAIYRIIFPNGKSYIGQTTQKVYIRIKFHCTSNSLVARAIKKYGWTETKVEILEKQKDPNDLNNLEAFYIKQFNSLYKENGYNILAGIYTETAKIQKDKRL